MSANRYREYIAPAQCANCNGCCNTGGRSFVWVWHPPNAPNQAEAQGFCSAKCRKEWRARNVPATSAQINATLRAYSIRHKEVLECERCGDELDNAKAYWLQLNVDTGLYGECGTVPDDKSQGCFAFGSACARAVLKAGGVNKPIKNR